MDDETHQLKDKGQPVTAMYTEGRRASDSEPLAAENQNPQQLSRFRILLLNLSFCGLNLMFLLLSVEVVPAQVQQMVGSSSKGSVLGGMVAAGAVLTLATGPLVGMACDRLSCRFGRRRPVMVAATVCLCVGLLGMGISAPIVRFKEAHFGKNGSSKLDANGICDVDLSSARCQPYASSDHPRQYHNRKLLALQSKQNQLDVDDQKLAGSIGAFMPFYFIVTVSYVSTITPYNALIADMTHPTQRGFSSGVMGGMILLGNIGGAAVGLFLSSIGVLGTYVLVSCLLAACIAVTVLSVPEPPSRQQQQPLRCRDVLFGFWQPLREHDFRWVCITRFLMQQGLSTTVGFLEYWLADMVNLPRCWNPAKGVSMLLLPLLCTAAVMSVVSGQLSDRMGQRKPLVQAASITMGLCCWALAAARGKSAFFVSLGVAVVFGAAFGSYQAADFALVMDVLPAEAADTSRDIAVWQQALVLPQALAVPVGGLVLDLFERVGCGVGLGYIILFSLTALYFILAGVFVSRIRKVN